MTLKKQRISSFLTELKSQSFENVVLIVHTGVITTIKHLLENKPIEEVFSIFKPEYGGICKYSLHR